MTPDATCNYVQAGVHNGRDYARRLDGAWFIWWKPGFFWVVSIGLDVLGAGFWSRALEDIEGIYLPQGEAIGEATVTAGEH